MITTTTTEEFDSDAVFNKLADCINNEIHWNYKPDGFKEFQKWLNDEIEKFRTQTREKAIEECLEKIGRPTIDPMSHSFTQIQDISKQVIYDKVSELKSL